MMLKNFVIVGAALTIAAVQPAAKPTPPAQPTKPTPPPTTLNCLLASNVFAEHETDQRLKEIASQDLVFYLGRLDPHMSGPQLKIALKQTRDSLQGVNAGALMNECLVEFRAKAALLQGTAQQVKQGK